MSHELYCKCHITDGAICGNLALGLISAACVLFLLVAILTVSLISYVSRRKQSKEKEVFMDPMMPPQAMFGRTSYYDSSLRGEGPISTIAMNYKWPLLLMVKTFVVGRVCGVVLSG